MIQKACQHLKSFKLTGIWGNSLQINKNRTIGSLYQSYHHENLFQTKFVNTLKYSFAEDKRTQNFKKKLSKEEMFKAQQEEMMKQTPDEDPTSYDQPSGIGGKIFMAVGVLGLVGIIAWVEMRRRSVGNDMDETISGMVALKEQKKVHIGGQWTLIDHTGKPFSSTDLAGSYYLIYFGFTKCPDICPTTLIKLGRVLRLIKKMPEYHYLNLKTIFVSCDPDRDTPKRLKDYLKNFHDEIIGVTGLNNDDPQLKNCMKSFKIYSNKIPLQNDNYSMDHTTITYLMDDENQYVDHLNPTLTQQEMAKAIVNRILDNEFKKMQRRKQKTGQK